MKKARSIKQIKEHFWYYRIIKFIKRIPFKFSVILRLIFLLFPSVFFTVAAFFCFWSLPQGKDVLIATLERGWTRGLILLAVLFFALVLWYSNRVLVYGKPRLYKDSKLLSFHAPRVLGFTLFTILILSFLKIPPLKEEHFTMRISDGTAMLLLLASVFVYYPLLYHLFKKIRDKKIVTNILNRKNRSDKDEKDEKRNFTNTYILLGCAVTVVLLINFFFYKMFNGWSFWLSLLILQFIFLLTIVIRRGQLPGDNYDPGMPLHYKKFYLWQEYEASRGNNFSKNIWTKILYYSNISPQEKWFFKIYNYIAAASVLVYLLVIYNYRFATAFGSLGTVMLAFGVLAGIFSVISFASIIYRINFHVILLVISIIIGNWFEPHRVNLIKDSTANYKTNALQRPVLKEYYINWLKSRKAELDTTTREYPLLFVLADGGASRSGYWTATVLGRLQDSTFGKFGHHLFCLSGASGGSVGNGTFMALLKNRNELPSFYDHSFKDGAASFLKNDFLSYTLARMLGPDFIRPMLSFIPINTMGDRAAALEYAMEEAGNKDSTFLFKKFQTGFAEFIPTATGTDSLPVFCINCTRMQDGRPSVVSNIKLQQEIFGKRIDILSDLDSGQDLKLSTAVALGARFPYVSPAGRINNSYYVDGGYFDNSGSGFVLEMITELRRLQSDPDVLAISPGIKKLGFYIIHVQNGESGDITPKKIHPLLNDLAAPVRTLVGAYGTQTSVNDWRLEKYMRELDSLKKNAYYFKVNLHKDKDSTDSYPMNWAISQYYINKMDVQLNNTQMKILLLFFKYKFLW